MRAIASYLAGLGILASLMFVGGAWTSPSAADLTSISVHPVHASFALADEFSAVVSTTTTTTAVLPPGCAIPRVGAQCAPTVVAGGLEFPEPEEPVEPRVVRSQPPAPAPRRLAPRNVEVWRPLVEAHFAPADVARALAVISCESSGDPDAKNPRSSASGLFQHLGRFWPERSVKAGLPGVDIFDPSANVAVAAWLVYEGGGWSHWNPSRHCWG
ncbi:MAG: lytic transglycosylase domain-containing protein [Acidimicrobiia bacterium]|nr:lytic transglycosylase domain-containing protein [Acidimicrobiia bacterium]